MQLAIGDQVQVWDDDRGRWWAGEVTVLNGDHPRHPWQAETISTPLDPEFIRPLFPSASSRYRRGRGRTRLRPDGARAR